MEVKTEIVTVTPEMAGVWLQDKAPNRSLKLKIVERYAREMKQKKWMFNGEPIIISDKGKLLDGQHRLESCLISHAPFDSLVVTGINERTFPTMNIGSRRSNADILDIKGEKNTSHLATALRLLYFHDSGQGLETSAYPTSQDILKSLSKHPTVRESVGICLQAKSVISIGAIAFVHCLASEHGLEAKADRFVEQVTTGENLNRGDPALTLRNKLLADRILRHHELKSISKLSFLIKAFNAYVQGKELRHLYWKKSEEFPSLEF